MLSRLYEPILWRSFTVANPLVRKNATHLFVDAFPVMDTEGSAEVVEHEMQKQLNVLDKLLMDPSAGVRVSAVSGVCRIMNLFWEMIPDANLRVFLSKLVNDLSSDKKYIISWL
jgi:condensin-2 complex subunit G2